MFPLKSEIFLIFSNFLSLKSFDNLWGKSHTKFVILDNKFCFSCSESDLILKHSKVPKCYDQNCRLRECSYEMSWLTKVRCFLSHVQMEFSSISLQSKSLLCRRKNIFTITSDLKPWETNYGKSSVHSYRTNVFKLFN